MIVYLTPEAQKQHSRLPATERAKIRKKLTILENEPFAGKKLLGDLKSLRSLKAWPYRIIYSVDEKRHEIWVVSILHRQGAYR